MSGDCIQDAQGRGLFKTDCPAQAGWRANVSHNKPRIYIIVADMRLIPLVQTRAGTPFKVGVSRDAEARLTQLQTGCPFRLSLYDLDLLCGISAEDGEKKVHARLSHIAIGGEWFFGDPAQAVEIILQILDEEAEAAWLAWTASL